MQSCDDTMTLPAHRNAAHMLSGAILKTVLAKARFRDDPARSKKQQAEDKLAAVIQAYFRRLHKKTVARLNNNPPKQQAEKAAPVFDDAFFDDDNFAEELLKVLAEAIKSGVLLLTSMVTLEIDINAVNKEALTAIQKYAFDLIKDLTATTREVLQSVISEFITTPGMTLGDVIERLPYSESRAALIATTEITRAYAEGQRIAGEATAEAWPDVPVTKMWHTNMDDRVCPICAPLDGAVVDIDEDFDPEFELPPAHPACRCWISYRTNINA